MNKKVMNILNFKRGMFSLGFILAFIIVLAIVLRFNQLGSNPPSLNWDETSIGYNAYSILKTGSDEYGNKFPLSFRSFDDFKPPVYIYITVPAIALFGVTEFAVRFPAAFFGTLAVVFFYFLVREVLRNFSTKQRQAISLLSAFFMAISPWHLQFSRAAYEGNLGLFFFITALYTFFVGLRKSYFLLFSSILFILSLYSYHSFRLIIPIFLVVILTIFWRELLSKKKAVIISIIIFIALSVPVYSSFIIPNDTQARLSMVTIFGESDALRDNLKQLQISRENNNLIGEIIYNRRSFYLREGIKGYFDHFTPNFLFLTGAGSLHHHAVNFGMMYLLDLPFLIAGLYLLIKKIDKRILVMFSLLLIAPLPSAITTGTPHGVRAIAMIPMLIFAVAFGLYFVVRKIGSYNNTVVSRLIIGGIFVLFILNFIVYLNQYYVETPRIYGYFWLAGNREAIKYASRVDKDYEKIVMSYSYDQPYIYYLFYNKIDPAWYQKYWIKEGSLYADRFKRVIGKYEFRNIIYSQDKELVNTLLIGTPNELSEAESIHEIFFPDGRVGYRFVSTK